MKISAIYSVLSILAIAAFISCATIHPNEKKLVGTWKTVSAEVYTETPAPAPAATTAKKTSVTPPDSAKASNAGRQITITPAEAEKRKSEVLNRILKAELKSTMRITIVDKKTKVFEKFLPEKTIKGTWKMTKKGTVITTKEMQSDRKIVMNLLSITDSTALVIEHLQYGDLKVKFVKEK